MPQTSGAMSYPTHVYASRTDGWLTTRWSGPGQLGAKT